MPKPIRRALPILVLLAAAAPATATAKDKVPTNVHTTFKVTYDVSVQYDHKQYWGGEVENTVSFGYQRLTGLLGTAEFVDGVLQGGVVATVKRGLKASLSTALLHADATSATCSGDAADVRGFVALGRAGNNTTWLAPLLGANVQAQCRDSEGRTSNDTLTFSAVSTGPVQITTTAVPNGAIALGITAADTEKTEFLKPFDLTVKSHYCPGYDVESTTSCVLHITGDTTYIRQQRWETPDLSDVLGPAVFDPPKLDRKKTKATSTVKCKYDCDAGIEVFQLPKRKAPMKAFARPPMVRIKGGRTGTLTAKLDAADRKAIAKQGAVAVVTIKAKGKTQRGTYLLALPATG